MHDQPTFTDRSGFWSSLHQGEDGSAYTLSYVMVIPILMLLICVVIETTLMMMAKAGTSYAAFSGARTGIVWSSASEDWSTAEERIKTAAVQSFVPFASGMGSQGSPPSPASDYVDSYTQFVDDPAAESYLSAKYANASQRLTVVVDGPPGAHDAEITVKVEYRFRFNIPGIGRLIGEPDGDGYSFPLRSEVTLQNEGPKNPQQDLGIGYGKLE